MSSHLYDMERAARADAQAHEHEHWAGEEYPDPSDRDTDPVDVTAEELAAWREGYAAWLAERGVA